ncbi:ArsR/SmtB family transcription factor [Natronobacterium texcoconense]|uniref:Helix-turn-helix domain-containing protein n=1 Tax=Natronobacterium texcoconense TaxID=1095778 RepID=A0A1H0Z2L9_NATTX|nr:winged helix-turn-helix domain-containing protein [Natronobacterium texcoconense]SDQ21381.1 Helix-turn-helix domain-containing protein [Natronobacterium texcoconense]
MSEERPLEDLAALLEDETARRILTEIYREPMSANALSERCDVSRPTVYRRLEDMRRCDLLVERTRPDPKKGHHHTVYATNLERIVVDLDDDGLEFSIDRSERMADRFTRLVEEM